MSSMLERPGHRSEKIGMLSALMRSVNISVYQNASALRSVEQGQDITAHNIATSSVAGFKKTDAAFESIRAGYLPKETLTEFQRGMQAQFPYIDGQVTFKQGEIRQTSNPHDVTIEGPGFFEMETPEGDMLYSRDGQFHLNSDGVLVNSQGNVVQGENGRIQLIPSLGEFTLNQGGEVYQGNNLTGRIRVMNFDDLQGLKRVEGGFMAGGQTPAQVEEPKVLQGFLENSNVNPLREMVNLISLSRIHEANHKMIQQYDQLFGKAINMLGQTG